MDQDIKDFLSEQEAQALAENKVFAADLGDLIKLPFKLAIDLAAQLNQDLKKIYQTIEQCPVTKTYPNLIDLWADLESAGNVTMMKAKQLALLLTPLIAPQCVLVIYLGDQRLTQDNAAVLKFIHEQLPDMRVHFVATYEFADLDKTYIPSNVTFSYLEKGTKLKLTDEYLKSTDYLPYIAKLLQKIIAAQDYFEDMMVYVWYLAKLGAGSLSVAILETLCQREMDETRRINYLVSLEFVRLAAGYFEQEIQEKDFSQDLQSRYRSSIYPLLQHHLNNAVLGGLKLETDYVYKNIHDASLYEEKTDFNRALVYWLRATLHWFGMPYPESLSWRTARVMLRRNIAPNEMIDINEINFALYQKLQSLAKILNIKLSATTKKLKYIARKDELGASKSLYYVGCNQGISFICSEEDFAGNAKANQPAELLSCVQALLEYYQCFPATANATQNIILDIDHGVEMPLTFSQIEKRCALLNIDTMKFNHEIFHLDLLKIMSTLTVSLSPALTAIDFSEEK